MNKKSSYQKQKDRIKELESDIRSLIGLNGWQDKVIITTKYNVIDAIEKVMWQGETNIIKKDE